MSYYLYMLYLQDYFVQGIQNTLYKFKPVCLHLSAKQFDFLTLL